MTTACCGFWSNKSQPSCIPVLQAISKLVPIADMKGLLGQDMLNIAPQITVRVQALGEAGKVCSHMQLQWSALLLQFLLVTAALQYTVLRQDKILLMGLQPNSIKRCIDDGYRWICWFGSSLTPAMCVDPGFIWDNML